MSDAWEASVSLLFMVYLTHDKNNNRWSFFTVAINEIDCLQVIWESFLSLPDSQLLCCHVDRSLQCLWEGGLAHVKRQECFHLSMPSQCTCIAEHMVCCNSVQQPYRPCVTTLLQISRLTVIILYCGICEFFLPVLQVVLCSVQLLKLAPCKMINKMILLT